MQSSHRAVVAGPADRSLTRSDAHSPLTVREIEVIRFLAKGFLYKEIADRMGISFSTVHRVQHKIFVKLHASNRTEAINNIPCYPSSVVRLLRRGLVVRSSKFKAQGSMFDAGCSMFPSFSPLPAALAPCSLPLSPISV